MLGMHYTTNDACNLQRGPSQPLDWVRQELSVLHAVVTDPHPVHPHSDNLLQVHLPLHHLAWEKLGHAPMSVDTVLGRNAPVRSASSKVALCRYAPPKYVFINVDCLRMASSRWAYARSEYDKLT